MASSVEEYWARRRELSPSGDQPAVADGDRRLALLVDLSDAPIVDPFERFADRLGEFDCLRPTPPDELHLTVKLFDRRAHAGDDGSDTPSQSTIDDLIAEIVADVSPFEIRFPRLNLFPDTVYAEVEDDDTLSRLNDALCDHDRTTTGDRDENRFLPHLTLGYFTGDSDYQRLVDFLEAERSLSVPTVTVDELALAAYDVTARHQSAMRPLCTYSL